MIEEVINENNRRKAELFADVNQLTGEGLGGDRIRVHIPDHDLPEQWLTDEVMSIPDYQEVIEAGSISACLQRRGKDNAGERLCLSKHLVPSKSRTR